jgi:hypothetical protein
MAVKLFFQSDSVTCHHIRIAEAFQSLSERLIINIIILKLYSKFVFLLTKSSQ